MHSVVVEGRSRFEPAPAGLGPWEPTPRTSLFVGGVLDEVTERRAVEMGERPRIVELEMKREFGAGFYDLRSLVSASQHATLTRLGGRVLRRPQFLALSILDQIRNDDVIFAGGEDIGFALAALLRARGIDHPCLMVRLHHPFPGKTPLRSAVYDFYRQYGLPRIDRIMCCTSAHLQYLHNRDRVPLDRLVLLRESVDQQFFRPDAPTAPLPAEILSDEPYIYSSGLELRDYETLIEAVRNLPVQLVISAGSPWSHHTFARGVETLPPNVHVSSFSASQRRTLYRGAAFVVVPVLPTLQAAGITVLIEAWAMGKAVIASRTVGLMDYVIDGVNALSVPPSDPAALRERIRFLLDRPEVAEQLGQAGLQTVKREHETGQYVRQVRDTILELTSGPG